MLTKWFLKVFQMKILKHIYQLLAEQIRGKINKAQYVIFVAVLTGLTSGLIAVVLKKSVHHVQRWIQEIPAPPLYLVFPAIGLLIVGYLTNRFFNGSFERGIGMVL